MDATVAASQRKISWLHDKNAQATEVSAQGLTSASVVTTSAAKAKASCGCEALNAVRQARKAALPARTVSA